MLAIWSLVPLPFLNPAWTSGNSQFTYYWRSLAWRILSITLLACEMSAIVWQFQHSLALPLFGIGMKTDLFQSCGHCWVFQMCWHIECSTVFLIWIFPLITKTEMRSFNLSGKISLSCIFSCLFIHTVWRFWLWNQTAWVQILVVPLTNCIFLGKTFCVSVSSISKGAHNSNNCLIGLLDFRCGSDLKDSPSMWEI